MGQHGEHRALVKHLAGAALLAVAASAGEAAECRLALLLAMDVSSSVDAAEDVLQRGGMVSARGAASALSKVTWALAIAFICTSIMLTVLSGGRQASVFDGAAADEEGAIPLMELPTPAGDDGDIPLPAAPSGN